MVTKLIKKENYIYKIFHNDTKIKKYKIIEIINNFEEYNVCDNYTQYFVKLENPDTDDDIYCIFFEKNIK
jgi:hypothetical protein